MRPSRRHKLAASACSRIRAGYEGCASEALGGPPKACRLVDTQARRPGGRLGASADAASEVLRLSARCPEAVPPPEWLRSRSGSSPFCKSIKRDQYASFSDKALTAVVYHAHRTVRHVAALHVLNIRSRFKICRSTKSSV
jgi:hypothetical protein